MKIIIRATLCFLLTSICAVAQKNDVNSLINFKELCQKDGYNKNKILHESEYLRNGNWNNDNRISISRGFGNCKETYPNSCLSIVKDQDLNNCNKRFDYINVEYNKERCKLNVGFADSTKYAKIIDFLREKGIKQDKNTYFYKKTSFRFKSDNNWNNISIIDKDTFPKGYEDLICP